MASAFQRDEIDFERTGAVVTIANNDVARLMYYLYCVCIAVDCNHDRDIQRFKEYQNWRFLSIEEQIKLIATCYKCEPKVVGLHVFFPDDELCGNDDNAFFTLRQVQDRFSADESIVITGQRRPVKNIMTFKSNWVERYYFDPMIRLTRIVNGENVPRRPAIVAPQTPTFAHTPLIIQRNYTPPRSNRYKWICGVIIVVIIIIIIGNTAGRLFSF